MTINEVAARQDPNSLSSPILIGNYGIHSFNLKNYTPEGSPYLDNSWFSGEIVMHDDRMVDEYAFKFDMMNNSLVVNIDKKIFSLPEGVFKSFSTETVAANGEKIERFFTRAVIGKEIKYLEEIVSSEKLSLMKEHVKKLVKANYNAALDVGNHKDKFFDEEKHYLKINDDYIEIKGSRKKISKQIQNRKLRNFVSDNNLNLKDVKDLSYLVMNFKH